MQGLLLVDKPSGISSFGVVSRVRGIIKAATGQKIKVGHSGTLDPFATGLLILAIGSYTKRLGEMLKLDKTYLVEMILGATSSTGDPEGELQKVSEITPDLSEIQEILKSFTGKQLQKPPAFSAIKINGQRAYKLARTGQAVDLPPREIEIYQLELISYAYPTVTFKVDVSSGTYIRSLVEDIGHTLQTGAYCSSLRRESIGRFNVRYSISLENLSYSKIEQSIITLEN